MSPASIDALSIYMCILYVLMHFVRVCCIFIMHLRFLLVDVVADLGPGWDSMSPALANATKII